jgi:hypothetical protein
MNIISLTVIEGQEQNPMANFMYALKAPETRRILQKVRWISWKGFKLCFWMYDFIFDLIKISNLIDTMKGLFREKGLGITFDSKETVIDLNNVKIEAFP